MIWPIFQEGKKGKSNNANNKLIGNNKLSWNLLMKKLSDI